VDRNKLLLAAAKLSWVVALIPFPFILFMTIAHPEDDLPDSVVSTSLMISWRMAVLGSLFYICWQMNRD
jgi:hypothetical protein